jgi:hypothetical protein
MSHPYKTAGKIIALYINLLFREDAPSGDMDRWRRTGFFWLRIGFCEQGDETLDSIKKEGYCLTS